MSTAEITIEQILGMAQRLKTQELAGLVSRLEAMLKGSPNTERIDQARKELFGIFPVGPNGPNGQFATVRVGNAVVLVPPDAEFAAAAAPIEKAWQQSGMTMAELNIVLEDIRKDIARREFGDLLEDES